LGNVYDSLGQYQTAIEHQQQSLAIAKEIGDRRGEGTCLGNLGLTYRSLEQYQTAIEHQQQWLAIAREIGDRSGEANSLGGLGNVYFSLRQYQPAIECHQQSLAIAREIGDHSVEANALFNSGLVLVNLGQLQDARSNYQAARALYDAMGQKHLVEKCDAALHSLEIPTATSNDNQKPGFSAKAQDAGLEAENRVSRLRVQQVPLRAWFLAGLGFAALLWWLMR
jgi:tetratricopeptide (TPR) repeat protein